MHTASSFPAIQHQTRFSHPSHRPAIPPSIHHEPVLYVATSDSPLTEAIQTRVFRRRNVRPLGDVKAVEAEQEHPDSLRGRGWAEGGSPLASLPPSVCLSAWLVEGKGTEGEGRATRWLAW